MMRTKEIAVCSFCTAGANKRVDYTSRRLNAALHRSFLQRNGVSLRSPAIFPLFPPDFYTPHYNAARPRIKALSNVAKVKLDTVFARAFNF